LFFVLRFVAFYFRLTNFYPNVHFFFSFRFFFFKGDEHRATPGLVQMTTTMMITMEDDEDDEDDDHVDFFLVFFFFFSFRNSKMRFLEFVLNFFRRSKKNVFHHRFPLHNEIFARFDFSEQLVEIPQLKYRSWLRYRHRRVTRRGSRFGGHSRGCLGGGRCGPSGGRSRGRSGIRNVYRRLRSQLESRSRWQP
jgi:hypothetical protein